MTELEANVVIQMFQQPFLRLNGTAIEMVLGESMPSVDGSVLFPTQDFFRNHQISIVVTDEMGEL